MNYLSCEKNQYVRINNDLVVLFYILRFFVFYCCDSPSFLIYLYSIGPQSYYFSPIICANMPT